MLNFKTLFGLKTLRWAREREWKILFAIALFAIVPQVLPVLTANALSGWDTHGHLYLTEIMARLLQNGHVSGYILNWEGGFPAFSLYPPLFFIVTAGPAALLPSWLSVTACYHLMVFALPLLFAISFMGYARATLPGTAWVGVPAIILVYLMLPGLGAYGVGLESLLATGLVPSFFALVLFTTFAWSLESALSIPSKRRIVVSSLLLGALFLSHTLTSIFAVFYVAVAAALGARYARVSALSIVTIAVLLSSWWTIPFILNLPYSSGEAILDQNALSSLSIFFPIGPAAERIVTTGGLQRELLAFERPPGSVFNTQAAVGLFFLISVSAGIVSSLKRGRYTLPLVFLGGIALVPGGFILSALGLPLHAYRFSACLWVIELILSAEGLSLLMNQVHQRRAIVVKGLCALFCVVACAAAWIDLAVLLKKDRFLLLHADDRPTFQSGENLLAFLAANPPQGRIAVESEMRSIRLFGSPHWLLTEIPRRLGLPTMPGVYAESSLSSPFVTPTLARMGNQLVWGAPEIARRQGFRRQSFRSMVERLRLFSVEMIVATSGKMRKNLRRLAKFGVTPVYENSDVALFSLGKPLPIVDSFKVKPFLFLEHGGISFRAFSKWLYTTPDLFDVPVLRIADYASLSKAFISQVAGTIVSCGRASLVTEQDLLRWREFGPVILANCPQQQLPKILPEGIVKVPYLFRDYHLSALSKALLPLMQQAPAEWRSLGNRIENERIDGTSNGPVLLRANVARCWRETLKGREILQVTPSFMALLGEGDFTLEYKC